MQLVFLVFLLAALTAALRVGGRTEHIGAGLLVAATIISPIVQTSRFIDLETGLIAVDALLLAGLLWLALARKRFWPTWAAAFQALAVLTHVARTLAGPINGNVYADLLILWSYPVAGALLWGSLVEARRSGAADLTPDASPLVNPLAQSQAQSRAEPVNLPSTAFAVGDRLTPGTAASARQLAPTASDELGLLIRLLQDNGVGINTPQLASNLLARTGSFAAAVATPAAKLRDWGMNERVIDALAYARSITRSALRRKLESRPNLAGSTAAVDYLHSELAHLREEQFRVLFLNARHRLIHDEAHSHGSVSEAPVFPREVVRRAIEVGAVHLILAHNHPGGDPTPSRADVATTRAIIEAARTIGVSVTDHIIVSPAGHVSMRAGGFI